MSGFNTFANSGNECVGDPDEGFRAYYFLRGQNGCGVPLYNFALNFEKMRIEIISGSPRVNSVTRRVALHLHKTLTETTDHEVGLIDMEEWDLPPMQSVFTSVENTPEQWRSLSEMVFAADGFILVSPEYNGSYSPSLKNLLDHFPKQHHLSRNCPAHRVGAVRGFGKTKHQAL